MIFDRFLARVISSIATLINAYYTSCLVCHSQPNSRFINVLAHRVKYLTSVYTPGALWGVQDEPQLVIPTNCHWSCCGSQHISGPPLSPCN